MGTARESAFEQAPPDNSHPCQHSGIIALQLRRLGRWRPSQEQLTTDFPQLTGRKEKPPVKFPRPFLH